MSKFTVIPAAVTDAGLRLGSVSGGVRQFHDGLAQHVGAAHGTPVEGVLDGLIGRWAQALPQFALAGDRLSAGIAGAAAGYQASDAAVVEACDT